MKTAIIYVSTHHGNTKKVIDAMAKVRKIELLTLSEAKSTDLSSYDCIGFASGIYYHKLHKGLEKFIENLNPNASQKVFIVYTCGINYINYAKNCEKIIKTTNCQYLGKFACRGYDTFGFFENIGGIAKKHPNKKDLTNAQEFIKNILR